MLSSFTHDDDEDDLEEGIMLSNNTASTTATATSNNNKRKKACTALLRPFCLFCMRVCIFMLSHVIFYLGPAHSCRELPLMDSVAIASFCLLVITLVWALFEGARFFICKATSPIIKRSNNSSSSSKRSGTAVLLMSDNNTSTTTTTTTTSTQGGFYTQTVEITPWILWYYVHAIGIIIFVLTYSIPGLSSLPSLSIIGAITICSAMTVCESRQKKMRFTRLFRSHGLFACWHVSSCCYLIWYWRWMLMYGFNHLLVICGWVLFYRLAAVSSYFVLPIR